MGRFVGYPTEYLQNEITPCLHSYNNYTFVSSGASLQPPEQTVSLGRNGISGRHLRDQNARKFFGEDRMEDMYNYTGDHRSFARSLPFRNVGYNFPGRIHSSRINLVLLMYFVSKNLAHFDLLGNIDTYIYLM